MVRRRILLLLAIFVFECVSQREAAVFKCGSTSNARSSWNLSINSRKNETGDWVTEFSAWKESKSPSNIILNVSHKVIDCEGKQIVFIEGVLNGGEEDKLVFHPKCGLNVAISNDGRSVLKIHSENQYDGAVLTNRPLKNNELMEVRLDKKINKHGFSWGIGITTYAPENIDLPNHMHLLKSGTWMMYDGNVFQNGTKIFNKYGHDLNTLKVGDRIGVLKNNYGALHFFVNGVDQGPAASNIPYPVYGVFEVRGDGIQGTIVNNHLK